jgi:threonylcarbamoyladenosine tRNA methylthiotransferase MtaB
METISFLTFGCKLNQAETAMMIRQAREHGYRVIDPSRDSDFYVIHTCTVTGRASSKCRQAIRRVKRLNPRAVVVVAGCYAQVGAGEIAGIPGVDLILGSLDKYDLFEKLRSHREKQDTEILVSSLEEETRAKAGQADFRQQTRAFLKIQDGCSRSCSYCIVPRTRGPARSVPQEKVVDLAYHMIEQGHQEIVLTGVHIGDYGREKHGRSMLSELLEALIRIPGLGRIRLSSLDSEDITPKLLDIMEHEKKICRHFHIPLQSGSDRILKLMGRRTSTDAFRRTVDMIFNRLGTVGLGIDVITGHPGESDGCFQETVRFIESIPVSYLHVFPFSSRPDTRAAVMEGQVNPRIRLERARGLRVLGAEKKRQFTEKILGRKVCVLIEGHSREKFMSGFSSEYARVYVPRQSLLSNRLVRVRAENLYADGVMGSVVGTIHE